MSSAPRSLPFIAYLSPLVGVALGYGATELQREFAPVGLFPVLVGIATGLAIVACLRLSGHTSARAHGLAALAAGAVCVGSMHYVSYKAAQASAEVDFENFQRMTQVLPQADLKQPPQTFSSFRQFVDRRMLEGRPLAGRLVRGAWLGVWWGVDAALVLVAAAATALFLSVPPSPITSQETFVPQDPKVPQEPVA